MEKKNEELAKTIGTIILLFTLIDLTIATVSVEVALWILVIFVAIVVAFLLFLMWHYYTQQDTNKGE